MGPNPVVTAPDGEAYELDHHKAGTEEDRSNMHRMGKTQELRRNFSFIPTFGFSAVLMISWEAMLNATSYSIPNGGLPAMIWMYVVSLFGMGAAVVSMAEMASMAPTSGGQYRELGRLMTPSVEREDADLADCRLGLRVRAEEAAEGFELSHRYVASTNIGIDIKLISDP